MRTITKFILTTGLIAGGVLAYSRVYKVKWSKFHQVTFKTTQPTRRTIIRKKIFSGTLIPHKEINLETHLTGIVDKLWVEVGGYVQQGRNIARIKIQPNPKEIEEAASKLRVASINLNQARGKYLRSKHLFTKKMLAKEAYEADLASWEQTKEAFALAEKTLQITQKGYTHAKGANANLIKATTKGTILALPAKEGSMVQATSGNARGTTVAVIGDMDHFLFSAQVSELDVADLTKGMTFTASLNAFNEAKLQVTLTKIAPKASEERLKNGEIKFAIEGLVQQPKKSKITLRAGYLAVAEVVVGQVDNVLAVPESVIQMKGKDCFVKCLHDGKMVPKNVVLGLSDGLYVEIKEGLTEADQLIVET
ncbi:Methyl-accepting chemotaxis sensory transducer [Cardinium endosymbiont cEper1 of Encarsia pergandiella]|uniref:efflux RND transporter periplasmic adaptor subunit n=1 Tax=Cardinium endosymbiont of Encarsia pergandiella TaxID=249402 RepID=UPI00027E9BF5|nr:efflux RND transporter periplasmic adaptor subunit [Cardinium endosymbiont of Encarsia pergandiella]CCM09978.1 Methyl-accepting chemotaxis sensory transducer [Cardinium endosymbiont cEper1 of Encarsia pergandiella]